jgi:hypothetical protein
MEGQTMLVTFSSPASADITMFGDVAIRLLKMMGHSGTVPGAMLADDIQPALERLEAAVAAAQRIPEPDEGAQDEDEDPVVSLTHRALPLIDMLKEAAKTEVNVMWDRNT